PSTHASQLNRVPRREKLPKTAGNACRAGPGCRLGTARTLAGLMDVDRDQLAMRDCEGATGRSSELKRSRPRRCVMSYSLPDLPYDYGALEPYCDGKVLELHHGKHHEEYVKGVNQQLESVAGESGRAVYDYVVRMWRDIS